MEHTIPNKATIIIHMNQEVCHSEVGIFILNDKILVKRLVIKDGYKILVSDNSNFYPIIVKESDKFYPIGKVIEVISKL